MGRCQLPRRQEHSSACKGRRRASRDARTPTRSSSRPVRCRSSIPGFDFDGGGTCGHRPSALVARARCPSHLLVIGGGLYRTRARHDVLASLGSRRHGPGVRPPGALPGQERDCVKVIERALKKHEGAASSPKTFAQALGAASATSYVVTRQDSRRRRRARSSVTRSSATVGRRPYTRRARSCRTSASPRSTRAGSCTVDKQMRTKRSRHVYAIGDIAGPADARAQGQQGGPRSRLRSLPAQPEVVRLRAACRPSSSPSPEMASVGLHRGAVQARRGLEVQDVGSVPRSRRRGAR